MNTFKEIPAHTKSLAHRKLIWGIATNDAPYIIEQIINGKLIKCPYYTRWVAMLNRCYDTTFHKKQPKYKLCTVTPKWLLFSNFKTWMKTQEWKNKALDKDILIPNNTIYAPNTCVFITTTLNNLLTNNKAQRGKYPQGVNLQKSTGKFRAQCRKHNKRIFLGWFKTPEAASIAYKTFKKTLIRETALKQTDPRITKGLLAHAKLL